MLLEDDEWLSAEVASDNAMKELIAAVTCGAQTPDVSGGVILAVSLALEPDLWLKILEGFPDYKPKRGTEVAQMNLILDRPLRLLRGEDLRVGSSSEWLSKHFRQYAVATCSDACMLPMDAGGNDKVKDLCDLLTWCEGCEQLTILRQ